MWILKFRVISDQRFHVDIAIRRERDPRVAGPLGIASFVDGHAGHRSEGPGVAAISADARHDSAGCAIAPAVLLPDAHQVKRIVWIHRQARLHCRIQERDAEMAWDVARIGERGDRR
jgi:hypothetical protein